MQISKFVIAGALLSAVLPIGSVALAAGTPTGGHVAHVDRSVREIAAQHPGDRVPVLIQAKHNNGRAAVVQAHGGQVKRELNTANLIAAEVPASRLDELAQDANVVRVAYDAPMQAQAKSDSTGSGSALTDSTLLTAYPSVVGAPALWGYKVRGSGIGVAVLDSGIKDDRPDFLGTLFGKNNGELP